jgi:hypothetical protein
MQCRSCGIEIADKALICYRCGTPTTEAKYQPAPLPPSGARRSRTLIATVLVIALLALLALYVFANVLPRSAVRFESAPVVVVVTGLGDSQLVLTTKDTENLEPENLEPENLISPVPCVLGVPSAFDWPARSMS